MPGYPEESRLADEYVEKSDHVPQLPMSPRALGRSLLSLCRCRAQHSIWWHLGYALELHGRLQQRVHKPHLPPIQPFSMGL